MTLSITEAQDNMGNLRQFPNFKKRGKGEGKRMEEQISNTYAKIWALCSWADEHMPRTEERVM